MTIDGKSMTAEQVERFRFNTISEATHAALSRIDWLAHQNDAGVSPAGILKEIARECDRLNEFNLAVTEATSASEIEELARVRNSI